MAAPPSAPEGGGNILTQRLGPLAAWVWLLIGTVAVGALVLWQRHGQGAAAAQTGQAQPGQVAGEQQIPDIILQNYTQQQQTQTQTAGEPPEPPPTTPPPKPPGPPGKPPPKPPKPPPKPPKTVTVTVARWKKHNTPWNSTLWGIANHYGVKGGYATLAKLNGIKDPKLIHPGQKIKVPV